MIARPNDNNSSGILDSSWMTRKKNWSLFYCLLYHQNQLEQWREQIPIAICPYDDHAKTNRASLVAQWLRIRLPMQGTQVRAMIQEDPTCRGATKPMCHNYWACALEPASHNYWAHAPQLLKPVHLEPVLRNKRSHCNEKPAHCNEEQPPVAATRESPHVATKTPTQPKINKINKFF